MDRSKIVETTRATWVDLADNPADGMDLQVQVVPSKAPLAPDADMNPRQVRTFCEECFLDFRNWNDNGTPIGNSLEERIAIAEVRYLRASIIARCGEIAGNALSPEMETADVSG